MVHRSRDFWVLLGLFLITSAISLTAKAYGLTHWLEVFGFITGALCVWLTVEESIWNFPISLVNVVAFAFVFFKARLFADAGLQVVYFILTLQGWYLWLYGGEDRNRLEVSRSPRMEAMWVAVAGIAATIGLAMYLRHINGAAPAFDALTTALSLCAQYLLNRKYLENWYCWIAADIIYIPLYAYKGLWLTSLLYGIFLCMATMGLLEWRRSYLRSRSPKQGFEPILEARIA